MELIDFGKLAEEAKKKDPNIDVGELFAKVCLAVIEQKNAYRGSKAFTESEVPKGLKNAVEKYFATHIHKDWGQPFKLARLERSNIQKTVIYAVPKSIYDEMILEDLGDDAEFEKGLAKIGKRFGVPIKLPWYCYIK